MSTRNSSTSPGKQNYQKLSKIANFLSIEILTEDGSRSVNVHNKTEFQNNWQRFRFKLEKDDDYDLVEKKFKQLKEQGKADNSPILSPVQSSELTPSPAQYHPFEKPNSLNLEVR